MEHVRGLSLDLDDTLWPITPVIHGAEAALSRWFADHAPGVLEQLDREDLRRIRVEVFRDNPELGHDFSALRRIAIARMLAQAGYAETLADAAFEAFFAARNAVTLFADVLPALERLAAAFPIVALTNGNAQLSRIGLDRHFVATVAARDVGVCKPHPDMFDAAARALDLPPEQILHAGDDLDHDVSGATAAGFTAMWINRGGEAAASTPAVRDLAELADRLLG
ncbi:MAG: HAD-IA family hydrolase [Pseudomonadota bacterium]